MLIRVPNIMAKKVVEGCPVSFYIRMKNTGNYELKGFDFQFNDIFFKINREEENSLDIASNRWAIGYSKSKEWSEHPIEFEFDIERQETEEEG